MKLTIQQIIDHKFSSVYTVIDILKDVYLFIMQFSLSVPYYLVKMLILSVWGKESTFNFKNTSKTLPVRKIALILMHSAWGQKRQGI